MSRVSRGELTLRTTARYRRSRWKEKVQIMDKFVAATGYSRKHAIALLMHSPTDGGTPLVVGGAKAARASRRYDAPVREALVTVWKTANWSEPLK
jgi:hypothetical protein